MAQGQEPTAQQISAMFVTKYYNTLLGNTEQLFKFYKEDSTALHAEYNETGNVITGLKPIQTMFEVMDFKNARIKLQFVDAQRSLNGSIFVITSGTLSTNTSSREFTQGFVLAAQQPRGYYVLNDVFRYVTPQDGPDAKKPYPAVSFGTFGSHGPASSTSFTQKSTHSMIPSHVVSDEQLSEADSTAATAGGSFATTEEITSRAALSEGNTGPKTISSVGSISDQEESDDAASIGEKSEVLNGPPTEEKSQKVEQDDKPAEHRRERPQRRQRPKRDDRGKKQIQRQLQHDNETADTDPNPKEEEKATIEKGKVEEEEQKPKEESRPAENPTSWAHAVFGSAYEPPAQPITVPKRETKRERKNKGSRSDRATKKYESSTKIDDQKPKREGAGRYQNSIYVSKLDSSTTQETLKEVFGQFGPVKDLKLKTGKIPSAFITFENRDAVDKALEMNGKLTVDDVVPLVQKNRRRERSANGERKETRESKSVKDEIKKNGDEKEANGGWSVTHRGRGGRPRGRGGKSFNGRKGITGSTTAAATTTSNTKTRA